MRRTTDGVAFDHHHVRPETRRRRCATVARRTAANDYHSHLHPPEGSDDEHGRELPPVNNETQSTFPTSPLSPSRSRRILLIAAGSFVVVAGLVLRFLAPSPLWLDEALSVNIAQSPLGLHDALRQDGHPALYYLLLGWWIDAFGDSDGVARSLSGVLGVATVVALGAASWRFGKAMTLTMVLLAMSSPFLIAYSVEVRMYSLVTLLVATGWWALRRAWDQPSPGRLVLVAVLSAAAVHTHYWLVFMVAGAGLTLMIGAYQSGNLRRALAPLVALATGSLTLLFWLPVVLHQLAHTGTPWATRARPAEVLIETMQALGGTTRFEGEALGLLLIILVLIGMFGVSPLGTSPLMLRPHRDSPLIGPAAATVIGLGLTVAVAFATGSAFEPRYAAIVTPLLLALAARGIHLLGPKAGPMALAVIVVLGLAVSVDNLRRDRSQGQEAAQAIDAGIVEGDIVLFCPDQVGPATVRYLRTSAERRAFPSGDGELVNWNDYLETVAATNPTELAREVSEAAGSKSVWLVMGSGYRLIDPACATLSSELANLRSPEYRVIPRPVFERMTVLRFPA